MQKGLFRTPNNPGVISKKIIILAPRKAVQMRFMLPEIVCVSFWRFF